jgi:hypothetical protein
VDFRISDTFLTSVTRLTAAEQKEVKLTAFDLQVNPASPGLQFHKLERARDKGFWSSSLLLCYAAHHDDAYEWAERRKIETHPTTGAAQLVEVRERVREVEVPRYVDAPAAPARPALLFADVSDGQGSLRRTQPQLRDDSQGDRGFGTQAPRDRGAGIVLQEAPRVRDRVASGTGGGRARGGGRWLRRADRVRSDGPDGIACWFLDTDYNEESFFVRHAYFLGANDPYGALKTTLKAESHRVAEAALTRTWTWRLGCTRRRP